MNDDTILRNDRFEFDSEYVLECESFEELMEMYAQQQITCYVLEAKLEHAKAKELSIQGNSALAMAKLKGAKFLAIGLRKVIEIRIDVIKHRRTGEFFQAKVITP